MNKKMSCKISKSLNPKSEIIEYLERHEIASEDEIAQALNLDIITVLDELLELEKKGIAVRVDEALSLGN